MSDAVDYLPLFKKTAQTLAVTLDGVTALVQRVQELETIIYADPNVLKQFVARAVVLTRQANEDANRLANLMMQKPKAYMSPEEIEAIRLHNERAIKPVMEEAYPDPDEALPEESDVDETEID